MTRCKAENDADGRGSFAAVERSMSDRLLDAHRRLVRIPLSQSAGNLFGGPALREQAEDRGVQAG
jgi:hypothetical protein